MNKFYNRAGFDVTSKVIPSTVKGQGARYVSRNPCTRCGGLGGSDKWKHTGWTCFQCGGSGKGTKTTPRCWTAEKLAQLESRAEVRRAKREAELEAKYAAWLAGEQAKYVSWAEGNSEFLAYWEQYGDRLQWSDCHHTVKQLLDLRRPVPDHLVEFVLRQAARLQEQDRQAAQSQFVGEVGKRQRGVTLTTFKRKIVRHAESRFEADLYVVLLTDAAGNLYKYFGSTPWAFGDVGEVGEYDFTVKAHEEYEGAKQTVLQRAKRKEQAA